MCNRAWSPSKQFDGFSQNAGKPWVLLGTSHPPTHCFGPQQYPPPKTSALRVNTRNTNLQVTSLFPIVLQHKLFQLQAEDQAQWGDKPHSKTHWITELSKAIVGVQDNPERWVHLYPVNMNMFEPNIPWLHSDVRVDLGVGNEFPERKKWWVCLLWFVKIWVFVWRVQVNILSAYLTFFCVCLNLLETRPSLHSKAPV